MGVLYHPQSLACPVRPSRIIAQQARKEIGRRVGRRIRTGARIRTRMRMRLESRPREKERDEYVRGIVSGTDGKGAC